MLLQRLQHVAIADLGTLKRDGNTRAVRERMLTMKEYNEILDLGAVEDWEKRFMQNRQ